MTGNNRCDAGFVGFPNAGKSALFNALTGRTDSLKMPRFATMAGTDLVLADIGGLHWRGKGKTVWGEEWLEIIADAKTLIFVIPIARGNQDAQQGAAQYKHLATVCLRQPGFEGKKRIVALNIFKMKESLADYKDVERHFKALISRNLSVAAVVTVCANNCEGIEKLIKLLVKHT